jgi:hypothetical protein
MNRLLEGKVPENIMKDVPVSERLHRLQSRAVSLIQEGTDFLDPSHLYHSIDTDFNPPVQIFSLTTKADLQHLIGRIPKSMFPLKKGNWLPAQGINFQSANDSKSIMGMNPRRSLGV